MHESIGNGQYEKKMNLHQLDNALLLPTPAQIIEKLDRFVIGQETAKRDLAVAVYNHCLSHAYSAQPGAKHTDLGGQHVLLMGPTGSGKTYLLRCIAKILGVPIVFGSATSLVETGYMGESVDSLLENLVAQCDGDVERAERGIIYIDEFDKIRKARGEVARDVSGEGVQNALLTLLDGRKTTTSGKHSPRVPLDVSKILFLCTGAFSDLPEIVRRRIDSSVGFGFGSHPRSAESSAESDDDASARATHEDLIEYGFIPEILGRFAAISPLKSLSEDELARVLCEAEDSILTKQRTLYGIHGVELIVPAESLRTLARMSHEASTGARGLVRLVRSALSDVSWRLPELHQDQVDRVVLTPAAVRRHEEPLLLRNGIELPVEWRSALPSTNPTLWESIESEPQARGEGRAVPHINELRAAALKLTAQAGTAVKRTASSVSDTRGWSPDRIIERLEWVKMELDWGNTTGSARKWWEAFENENQHRMALVLRLAEELLARKSTITEFFLAYVYSNCDNIQANLHYLDYTRLKKEEERKKKDERARKRNSRDDSGETGVD